MKARDIIPSWPRGRSTIAAMKWHMPAILCCQSMAISLFQRGTLDELRRVPWMKVVVERDESIYRLHLSDASGTPRCSIQFCPWCGARLRLQIDDIRGAIDAQLSLTYHEEQQILVDDYRAEQFRIRQFVLAGGGREITREQFREMFPNLPDSLRPRTRATAETQDRL